MTRPSRVMGLIACLAVAVGACGSDSTSRDDARLAVAEDPTTTTQPPTTQPTTTTISRPPVIVSAGDSIIYDVSPVLADALEPDAARVIPLVAPTLGDTSSSALHERIQEEDPDLVIVMVGVWERVHKTASGHELGEPGFVEEYTTESLDPLRDVAAAGGGRVLLLGPPHLRDLPAEAQVNELETIWREYAAAEPVVDFADTDRWLGDLGGFVELASTTGGDALRLRRLDGIHLCEEGARRIVEGLIETIGHLLPAEPRGGWQQGAWTDRFPADECPPVL